MCNKVTIRLRCLEKLNKNNNPLMKSSYERPQLTAFLMCLQVPRCAPALALSTRESRARQKIAKLHCLFCRLLRKKTEFTFLRSWCCAIRHERDGITWHRSIAGSRCTCGKTIKFFEILAKFLVQILLVFWGLLWPLEYIVFKWGTCQIYLS